MVKRRYAVRSIMNGLYLLGAYIFLKWFYSGNPLCGEIGRPSLSLSVVRLTLLIALLDVVASQVALLLLGRRCRAPMGRDWVCALAAAGLVGTVLILSPEWIYKGSGVFRLEGTVADVSCLFEEGYGMVFPFTVAPLFAALTLAREFLSGWLIRSQFSEQVPPTIR